MATGRARPGEGRIVIDLPALPVVGVAPNDGKLSVELAVVCDGAVVAVPEGRPPTPAIAMARDVVVRTPYRGTKGRCPGAPVDSTVAASAITLTPLPAPAPSLPAPPLRVGFFEATIRAINGWGSWRTWATEAVDAAPIVPRFVYAFVRPARAGSVEHLAIVIPRALHVVVGGEPQSEAAALTGDFTLIELPVQRGGAASAEATFAFDDASVLAPPTARKKASSPETILHVAVDVTFGLGDREPLATLSISRRR